jgi:hypothetical protein
MATEPHARRLHHQPWAATILEFPAEVIVPFQAEARVLGISVTTPTCSGVVATESLAAPIPLEGARGFHRNDLNLFVNRWRHPHIKGKNFTTQSCRYVN